MNTKKYSKIYHQFLKKLEKFWWKKDSLGIVLNFLENIYACKKSNLAWKKYLVDLWPRHQLQAASVDGR